MLVKQARAASSKIRQHLDFIVVAMKKKNSFKGVNPNSESVIEAGDCLTTLGTAESLRCVEEIAG